MAGPRASDIKVIVGATLAVLIAGGLIAIGIYTATQGGKTTACPELNVGRVSDIRRLLQNGGPYPQTGGGACTFYLALDDNDIVAYKALQPSGCTLRLKRDHWECGGRRIEPQVLAQYPVTLRNVDNVDAVIVDLRPVPAGPTTTATSSPPHP